MRLWPDRPPAAAAAVDFDAESWNHALVPSERLASFLDDAGAAWSDPADA